MSIFTIIFFNIYNPAACLALFSWKESTLKYYSSNGNKLYTLNVSWSINDIFLYLFFDLYSWLYLFILYNFLMIILLLFIKWIFYGKF